MWRRLCSSHLSSGYKSFLTFFIYFMLDYSGFYERGETRCPTETWRPGVCVTVQLVCIVFNRPCVMSVWIWIWKRSHAALGLGSVNSSIAGFDLFE